jgi:hypothetical protein
MGTDVGSTTVVGTDVSVGTTVGVGVSVGTSVGVGVSVGATVGVGVGVSVGTTVGVGVSVGTIVGVGVPEGMAVDVGVGVGESVREELVAVEVAFTVKVARPSRPLLVPTATMVWAPAVAGGTVMPRAMLPVEEAVTVRKGVVAVESQ